MNIGEALIKSNGILKEASIKSYILDGQLLLSKVLNKDKMFIIMNRGCELTKEEEKQFFELIKLREDKMPVKYILGHTEFMGIDFKIKRGVLIPRGDTEILVEEVIKIISENNFKDVCDLCSGSGAIGISIAKFLECVNISAYDIAKEALETTEMNIEALGLKDRATIEKSDLLTKAMEENKSFDIIVSNPPYIRREVIPTLISDVKDYEPYTALCGGEDGLDFYRKITEQSKSILRKGGVLAYEIGYDQREDVTKILLENGFEKVYSLKDFAEDDRVVIGYKNF